MGEFMRCRGGIAMRREKRLAEEEERYLAARDSRRAKRQHKNSSSSLEVASVSHDGSSSYSGDGSAVGEPKKV
jgi:hypothetical protein